MQRDAEQKTFAATAALAAFCRGQDVEVPGARPERCDVYRSLIRNGIEDALRRAYPVLHSILRSRSGAPLNPEAANGWEALVDDFLLSAELPSPHLWQMPRSLIDHAHRRELGTLLGLPYLADLLLFEWIEIEVHMMEDVPTEGLFCEQLTATSRLTLTAESRLVGLGYPVFRGAPEQWAAEQGSYFVIVFRHPQTLEVRFIEVGAPFLGCLQQLLEQPTSVAALTARLQAEVEASHQEAAAAAVAALVDILRAEGALFEHNQ